MTGSHLITPRLAISRTIKTDNVLFIFRGWDSWIEKISIRQKRVMGMNQIGAKDVESMIFNTVVQRELCKDTVISSGVWVANGFGCQPLG